jgi:hypothetical protein
MQAPMPALVSQCESESPLLESVLFRVDGAANETIRQAALRVDTRKWMIGKRSHLWPGPRPATEPKRPGYRRHFVIIFRGDALAGGVGAGGEIENVSQAL